MSRRSLVIGIVVVSAIVLALMIILDGTPGGPIIVITPDPEPGPAGSVAKETVTGYSTGWSFGCDGNEPAIPEDNDGITWRFARWATIDKAVYKLSGMQEAGFSELTFSVGGKVLEIHAVPDQVPRWIVDGKQRSGKLFTTMPHWPKDLIGHMTNLSIDGKGAEVKYLEYIHISFNKHSLLKDCK